MDRSEGSSGIFNSCTYIYNYLVFDLVEVGLMQIEIKKKDGCNEYLVLGQDGDVIGQIAKNYEWNKFAFYSIEGSCYGSECLITLGTFISGLNGEKTT